MFKLKYNQPKSNLMEKHYVTPAGEATSDADNIQMMLRAIRREKAWKKHLKQLYDFKRQQVKRAS